MKAGYKKLSKNCFVLLFFFQKTVNIFSQFKVHC